VLFLYYVSLQVCNLKFFGLSVIMQMS